MLPKLHDSSRSTAELIGLGGKRAAVGSRHVSTASSLDVHLRESRSPVFRLCRYILPIVAFNVVLIGGIIIWLALR